MKPTPKQINRHRVLDNRTLLDTIRINGEWTPGYARVQPITQSIDWQTSRTFAGDSEGTRFAGNKLKDFSVKFVFLTVEEKVEWMKTFHRLLAQPLPSRSAKEVNAAKPVDVVHPYFADSMIRLAVTRELIGPYYDVTEEKGAWVVLWNGKEYREPTAALPAKLVQPIIGPEGQQRAETAIEKQTRLTEEDTARRLLEVGRARAGIPRE